MILDKKKIFDGLREKFLKVQGFDDAQVDVIDSLVDEFISRGLTDIRWLAYMMATAWGECKWRPIREIGKGRGRPYGKPINGQIYYGRGLVQLTWLHNYKRMSDTLGVDLVGNPELALVPKNAVQIMFEGMTTGKTAKDSFTKYQLQDFFNDKKDDPVNARKIINGLDKAEQFAKWHRTILEVLKSAKEERVQK